jgi:hypothetical protein
VTSVASVRAAEDVAEQLITLALFPSSGLSCLVRWPHGGRSESRKTRLGESHEAERVQFGLAASAPENLAEWRVLEYSTAT